MFTVKHCTPLGNEAIYETTEVTFSPYNAPVDTDLSATPLTGSVWYVRTEASGELIELRSGTVYVMNDSGSTVAKYDLGGWGNKPK